MAMVQQCVVERPCFRSWIKATDSIPIHDESFVFEPLLDERT